MSTRRERRQQQRRQQQRRASGSGGGSTGGSRGISQMWIALGVVIVLVALILVARAAGVFTPPAGTSSAAIQNTDASGPTLGEHMPDLGNAHIPTGQKGNFTSLPPTSGEHYAAPAGPTPWGIKTTWLPFEVTTHNLEHGGIVIVYRDLSTDENQRLQALVRNLSANGFPKIVLEPYPDLQGGKVALTAWNWVLKLQGVDETSIVKFVRQHTDGEAPENGTP